MHGGPAKCHAKEYELMLSTKNLPAEKFKVSKLSPTWTGPCKVLECNAQNQNGSLDCCDFPELSNICNKFNSSLLKPFTLDDYIDFSERKLNRPAAVEEARWEVAKVLTFRNQPKTGKQQYEVQWKGWPTKYTQWLFTAHVDEDLI